MVERYVPKQYRGLKRPKKGARPTGSGRQKGTLNRMTISVKTALEESAVELGYIETLWSTKSGKYAKGAAVIGYRATGRGGLTGFMTSLGLIKPEAYATLWGKLLPHTLNVNAEAKVTVTTKFKESDLAGKSLAELMAMQKEAIGMTEPLMIDITPVPARRTLAPASMPTMEAGSASSAQSSAPTDPPVEASSGPTPSQDRKAAA